MNKRFHQITPWIIFISLSLIWGSSFILMKRGLEVFTSNQTGALRISLAFIFTAIIGFRRFRNLKKEDLQSLILVGLLGSGFPYFLLPLSISRLDSSIVGVLGATVPLFTLVIGVIGFKLAYKRYQLWGVLIGLAGTALLLLPNIQTGWSGQLIYGSYALIASICYGTCINIIHSKLRHLYHADIHGIRRSPLHCFSIRHGSCRDYSDPTQSLSRIGIHHNPGFIGNLPSRDSLQSLDPDFLTCFFGIGDLYRSINCHPLGDF